MAVAAGGGGTAPALVIRSVAGMSGPTSNSSPPTVPFMRSTRPAVAWVLTTVFIRFCEDNRLVDAWWLSGSVSIEKAASDSLLARAQAQYDAYIDQHPDHSDVQYLQAAIEAFGQIPAAKDLVAKGRNPLWTLPVSSNGAKLLLNLWREQGTDGQLSRAPTEESGERWHRGNPTEGELAVGGPRANAVKGPLTALWTERRHYKVKKNGYHGGISPQEMVAPLVILAHQDHEVPGWTERHISDPSWWLLTNRAAGEPITATIVKTKVRKQDRDALTGPTIFDILDEAEKPPAAGLEETSDWVTAIISSDTFVAQAKQGGRRRAPDEIVSAALRCLGGASGHQVSERELAAAVDQPALRIRGLIAQLQRLLNVDGYQIIGYTLDGGHIRLDRELLLTQFGLEKVE